MKKLLPLVLIASSLTLGAGVFFLTQQLSGNFLTAKAEAGQAAACTKQGSHHTVAISGDRVEPVRTKARLCDTLTILNNDDKLRDMAFGVHDRHTAYNGISVKSLLKGQSFTVVLDEKGTYLFHDHYQDEIAGDFTVR
jgi:hypothetical protein